MKNNGFVMLEHDLLRSEQVMALSANAKALLLALANQFNGRNNGEIIYSARMAKTWLRCGSTTAYRAFIELETAGLIEAVERGSFDRKTGRGRATTWRLTFL